MKSTLTGIAFTLNFLAAIAFTGTAAAGISIAINPFGVPAIGTGVALYADTSGTQSAFAQGWTVEGRVVNHDAPNSVAVLADPPKVQRRQEALLADGLDAANPGAPYSVNDSYWGDFFTDVVLGNGFNGHGTANPDGSANTIMELHGGTTFGLTPSPSELLLYLVVNGPTTVQGELAIGASTLEQYWFCIGAHGQTVWPADPDFIPCIPEPTALTLAALCLGFGFGRRRRSAWNQVL